MPQGAIQAVTVKVNSLRHLHIYGVSPALSYHSYATGQIEQSMMVTRMVIRARQREGKVESGPKWTSKLVCSALQELGTLKLQTPAPILSPYTGGSERLASSSTPVAISVNGPCIKLNHQSSNVSQKRLLVL
jgi:hypothetical protein